MGAPNFLCIGAHKAGTNWLYACLSRHPEVYLTPVKELHYFDDWASSRRILRVAKKALRQLNKDRDIDRLRWYLRFLFGFPKNDRWYKSLFPDTGYAVVGEINPGFSRLQDAEISKVKAVMPNARILLVMRHPVDRVWSDVRWRFGLREGRDIATVSHEEMVQWIDGELCTVRTRYLDIIQSWEKYFPKEQFLGLYYDALRDRPEQFLRRICEFLSIEYDPSAFAWALDRRIHVSPSAEMPAALRAYVHEQYDGMVRRMMDAGHDVPPSWLEGSEQGSAHR